MSDRLSTAVRTVCLSNRVSGRFKFFSFEPVVDVLARGDLGDSANPAVTDWISTDSKLIEGVVAASFAFDAWGEFTSEQESSAKDGNLFSAERNQLKVETE